MYVLQNQFGVSEENAKELASSMIEAGDAIEEVDTTVDIFGEFYQATQKVNAAMKKATDLAWGYERALKGNANSIELYHNLK
jgi:hypothetical protein